ncbi:inorganic polyphosphate/ATP-NAD kinase [Williamsoniiplasma somnilux]|uniref:NAD kinase n=1 Tax=Williamsoniiplasma somnilux TaxID=215578 RepID=A0A2K8NYS1_9MOLU|nr:NAD(+)/NADH kinase [Williamsoniiplasma somnilux]ATZ18894.1 inorganic polyphosphate/ATP-NAD kinase [Williamsoniiplasma somnilux]
MRYAVIRNTYVDAIKIEQALINLLKTKPQYIHDEFNPNYVFVIGGDGTFLSAVQKFQNKLSEIIFVPIKFGGIGFYTNHNSVTTIKEIIPCLENHLSTLSLSLIEVNHGSNINYAINEIKIMNNIKPMRMEIYINEELLEAFKGTGLVFSTPSGSTGFMKSSGGAIIFPNQDLFEMQELFPVSTNKFRTLNAPIIFNKDQIIEIVLENKNDFIMSIDTKNVIPENEKLIIKISKIKINVLSLNPQSKTKILNDIFVLNDSSKN